MILFSSLSSGVRRFFQVWFAGEKIGEGTGKTRREAQCQAAESSLMHLSCKISYF